LGFIAKLLSLNPHILKNIITGSLVLFLALALISWKQEKIMVFPVAIQFTSECCGVPNSAPVYSFIKAFKKQHKIKKLVVYRIGPLGREGEYDLAFPLKELNSRQARLFKTGLRSVTLKLKGEGKATLVERHSVNTQDLPGRATIEKQII
jgi:hypothetical protein